MKRVVRLGLTLATVLTLALFAGGGSGVGDSPETVADRNVPSCC